MLVKENVKEQWGKCFSLKAPCLKKFYLNGLTKNLSYNV